ncbi:MAG: hypothetical protein GY888_16545 [Planctomycetaceae bacterium]|nr:hypothetical protein [Planctomycetaceae bacterium]
MSDNKNTPCSSTNKKRRPLTRKKKLLFSSFTLLLSYSFAELVLTSLYMQGTLLPIPTSTVVLEQAEQGASRRYDPIRGCLLAQHPNRVAIVASNGLIETEGIVKGNNRGFPDRDDFQLKRGKTPTRRYAILGDSMTSAQFLQRNWPDMVEDLASGEAISLKLYNFSVFGAGLDNWRSILLDHVEAEGYELDGVIFAVCCDDLHRGFTFWDDSQVQTDEQGRQWGSYGRMLYRDKRLIPANLEEAAPFLLPINWRLLPHDQFEQVLAGKKRLSVDRKFKLYLTSRCVGGLAHLFGIELSPTPVLPPITPACLPSMDEIGTFLRRHKLPYMVVQLPMRYELLNRLKDAETVGIPEQTLQFAMRINAGVADGSEAFMGLDEAGIRDCWLPIDGHWNQAGSDRFARYMVNAIKDWETKRPGRLQ